MSFTEEHGYEHLAFYEHATEWSLEEAHTIAERDWYTELSQDEVSNSMIGKAFHYMTLVELDHNDRVSQFIEEEIGEIADEPDFETLLTEESLEQLEYFRKRADLINYSWKKLMAGDSVYITIFDASLAQSGTKHQPEKITEHSLGQGIFMPAGAFFEVLMPQIRADMNFDNYMSQQSAN